MNTGLSTTDLAIIRATISSFEGVESATLFGSNYKAGSDIDIAIKLKQPPTSTPNPISLIHDKLNDRRQSRRLI